MRSVLIIGYGNTLRGDDAAGVRAAELIAQQHPEFECLSLHQLVPELAERIAECETVIFIDAQHDIAEPVARLIPSNDEIDQPRTHFISPESLLALSRRLYQRAPLKAYSIGIPATDFEFSEQLSPSTSRAVSSSIKIVEQLLQT
jgi:hydrogenase maturation protease